jgi:hypothetical protein
MKRRHGLRKPEPPKATTIMRHRWLKAEAEATAAPCSSWAEAIAYLGCPKGTRLRCKPQGKNAPSGSRQWLITSDEFGDRSITASTDGSLGAEECVV